MNPISGGETADLSKPCDGMLTAVEAAGLAIYQFDPATGRWQWTPWITDLLGGAMGVEDSMERLFDRVHPEDAPGVRRRWERMVRSGGPERDHLEFRVHLPDGRLRWMCDIARQIHEGEGMERRLVRVVGTLQDITDRQRADRELVETHRRLTALMQALPVGVSFSDDATCERVTGNPAVLAQFGAGPEDNISASTADQGTLGAQLRFYREGRLLRSAELPLQRAVRENREIPPMELEICLPSGRQWYAQASGAPIRDAEGRVVGGVAVTVDITARRQMEEALRENEDELRRLNANLEERVEQRTAQLRRLAAELIQAEERERRRLAEVLHDELQQLLVGARFRLERARSLEVPARALRELRQVDDLLEEATGVARNLSQEMSPAVLREGDLTEALRWLRTWMRKTHGLQVTLDVHRLVGTFEEEVRLLLFRCVREVLLNVVKHAEVKRARLTVRSLVEGMVEVEVSDRGRGFEPAAALTGTGLGLLSIRERLQSAGGSFEVSSAPGRGSRFRLRVPAVLRSVRTVPAAPAAPATPPVAPMAAARPSGMRRPIRVLVADDHAVIREGLVQLLREKSDLEVVGVATDGVEAVRNAVALEPDVVLMDISMPVLDGLEATRRMVAVCPEIRVIGLTAGLGAAQRSALRQAGAVASLDKGGESEALLRAIRRAGGARKRARPRAA